MQDSSHEQPVSAARDVHPMRMISPRINGMGIPIHRRHAPSRGNGAVFAHRLAPAVIRLHGYFLPGARQCPRTFLPAHERARLAHTPVSLA